MVGRQPARWVAALAMVGGAAIVLLGCGQREYGKMEVEMTFTPNPATAVVAAADWGANWTAPYRVTVRETGGVGGRFRNFSATTYANVDGERGDETTSGTTADFPTFRLNAGGTFILDAETHYNSVNGGRAVLIDVVLTMTDDEGVHREFLGQLAAQ